jgi:hypothetical protein
MATYVEVGKLSGVTEMYRRLDGCNDAGLWGDLAPGG